MKELNFGSLIFIFVLISCSKKDDGTSAQLPMLSTLAVNSVTSTSAVSGGEIISNGGWQILEQGVVWGKKENPSLNIDAKLQVATTSSRFDCLISPLEPETRYFVRAFARNNIGVAYGNEVSFTTSMVPKTPVLGDTGIYFFTGGESKIVYLALGVGTLFGEYYADSAYVKFHVSPLKSSGGMPVERGIVWGTTSNPDISTSAKKTMGSGTGWFKDVSIGPLLESNAVYYLREFATNAHGTTYGRNYMLKTPNNLSQLSVGDYHKGGMVFYILKPGDKGYDPDVKHGLLAGAYFTRQQGAHQEYRWGNAIETKVRDTLFGSGQSNTQKIVQVMGSGNHVASISDELDFWGYNDWYLPSLDELKLMYNSIGNGADGQMKNIAKLTGYRSNYYWTSSETSVSHAYSVNFLNGTVSPSTAKGGLHMFCPIRNF